MTYWRTFYYKEISGINSTYNKKKNCHFYKMILWLQDN